MNTVNAKLMVIACLLLVLGFAVGFLSRGVNDNGSTKTVVAVPVHRMSNFDGVSSANRLLGPELWGVAIDPFWSPMLSPIAPLPVPSLANFPVMVPKVQTLMDDKEVRVIVQLPGLTEKDVDVQVGKDALTIKGQKSEEHNDKNKAFQAVHQAFEEAIQLPCKVDGSKAKATVQNGELTVAIPKADTSIAHGNSKNWRAPFWQ